LVVVVLAVVAVLWVVMETHQFFQLSLQLVVAEVDGVNQLVQPTETLVVVAVVLVVENLVVQEQQHKVMTHQTM
jgi:hypothetical protein